MFFTVVIYSVVFRLSQFAEWHGQESSPSGLSDGHSKVLSYSLFL